MPEGYAESLGTSTTGIIEPYVPGFKADLPSLTVSSSQAKALLASLSASGLSAEALLLSSALRRRRLLREQRASSLSSSQSSSASTPTTSSSPSSPNFPNYFTFSGRQSLDTSSFLSNSNDGGGKTGNLYLNHEHDHEENVRESN
ncbi:hypothetical protein FQA47_023911 [Oryzias melastigma]|uniref:Uncharacterized protein n=1 Tax=Oryzias melastigma TaxID=30732 RepID=A0A834C714_ORYME|nr:hypothetical protein FQA47_023911 [Oryzias melastigma]